MVGAIVLLLVLIPLAELFVVVQVAQAFGVLNTIALLILVSAVGAWVMKREGLGVWRRFQRQIAAGQVPGREMADGVMVLSAGGLLLVPGFLTDLVGIALLLPPVRAVVRAAVVRRATRRAGIIRVESGRVEPWGRLDG